MNRKPDSTVYEIKPETEKALQERYRDATPGQKETTKKSEAEYNDPNVQPEIPETIDQGAPSPDQPEPSSSSDQLEPILPNDHPEPSLTNNQFKSPPVNQFDILPETDKSTRTRRPPLHIRSFSCYGASFVQGFYEEYQLSEEAQYFSFWLISILPRTSDSRLSSLTYISA